VRVKRFHPNYQEGLSFDEVESRKKQNLCHYIDQPKTKSIREIIFDHVFTYFNLLNVVLAVFILIAGILGHDFFNALKNCLFLGVVFCNTIIGMVQEILSKRIVDRLSFLVSNQVQVVRSSSLMKISVSEIVLDDVMFLETGNQVAVDSIVLEGELEVNEAFLTGEEEPVFKKKGDFVFSGSFVVGGKGYVQVDKIGKDNYISKISHEAKEFKKANSVIMASFLKLLKLISILIVPIGLFLFFDQLVISDYCFTDAVFATAAALIGMIPEGLILLTSSVMAVSVLRMAKYHVLVQELYCTEILARVNVICLDKTGTITEGKMEFVDLVETKEKKEVEDVLCHLCGSIEDESATFLAISAHYESKKDWKVSSYLPFSSRRKYMKICFLDHGTYLLGAPEFVLKNFDSDSLMSYQKNYRVLALASCDDSGVQLLGYVLLQDKIRKEAPATLNYFENAQVAVKIISGDNLHTVLQIAKRAGLSHFKAIDVSLLNEKELLEAVFQYDIFARVLPEEKKKIVEILQKKNLVVAMTGDGVNDVLALRQSDCAITVATGSDAAKNVSQLILLDSNFDSLPKVVKEGRRIIHNIKRSASLLLVKTIFTIGLILLCIITGNQYFFVPIQLTLITTFTIGIPSFFLALEENNELVTGEFFVDILKNSIPVAFTVIFNVILVLICQNIFGFSSMLCSTFCVLSTALILFGYLFVLCKPFDLYRILLFSFCILGFFYAFIFQGSFFDLVPLSFLQVLLVMGLFVVSVVFYFVVHLLILKLFHYLKGKKFFDKLVL